MNKLIIWARLPSAGLGNKLLVWANAQIYAQKTNTICIVTGWVKLHLGPWLRNERSKRFYASYFKYNSIPEIIQFLILRRKSVISHPSSVCNVILPIEKGIICFNKVPHWSDWFCGIREYRQFVIKLFFESLKAKIRLEAEDYLTPFVSLHVRMGDFRVLNDHEDFSKLGAVRTPLDYFIQSIENLRRFIGREFPVTIFSDGSDQELQDLLKINNVTRAPNARDIIHLIAMSKSKLIILSAGSSFSQWAGFLSDAILLNHYQHTHARIRPEDFDIYEGEFNPDIETWSATLKNQLKLL